MDPSETSPTQPARSHQAAAPVPAPYSARLATFIRDRALGETTDGLSPTADDSVSGKTTWSDD